MAPFFDHIHPHTPARAWLVLLVASVMIASLGYLLGQWWLLLVAGFVVLAALMFLGASRQAKGRVERTR